MEQTSNTHFKRKKLLWFTLVELIVVITILAILGTIGFISIQGYSSSARDSSRVSNLVNLHKGLTIYQVVSGLYPMPESTITITASGSIVGYQGFARDQVANVAKLSAGATKDPLDPSIYTTYSVNAAQVRMQLMAFLENGNGISAFIDAIPGTPSAYAGASSYSIRSPLDKGDSVGILLGTGTNLYQSVQELYVANSFTGVDIMNSTGTYTLYMSKSQQYSGTGTALRAGITGGGLIGYWNFDEGAGMTTYDKSGNGYHGTLSGTTLPVWTTGKVGKALDFGGSGGILFGTSPSTEADSKEPASLTLGVWVKFQWDPSIRMVMDTSHGSGGTAGWVIQYRWDLTPHKMDFAVGDTAGWNDSQINMDLGDDQWHLLNLTFSVGKVSAYVDGVFIQSTQSQGNYRPTNAPLEIGHWWSPTFQSRMFIGIIDEVRIYNRALTHAEIQTLYNATK